jgi:predicted ATP-dependent endonuclease of OLD family
MCRKGNAPASFLDRHIVAFLSIKDRNMVDPFLIDVNSQEKHQQIMASLQTLAMIQSRSRMGKFPEITKTLAGMLDPIYERFHDRDLRESLKKKIEEIKELGDINKIKNILENSELNRKDFRSFRSAMIEYAELKKEKTRLEKKMTQEGEFGKSTGRQVAAMVSGFIGGIIILIFTIFGFSG